MTNLNSGAADACGTNTKLSEHAITMDDLVEPVAPPAKPFNKQLFENSGLKELFADFTDTNPAKPGVNGFFNERDPNLAILHEKPEHRLLLMLKARGMSNREIARTMGYTDAWISQLMRQPWARRTLAEEITQAGRNEIDTLLEGAAADSVNKLIELRDDPETPKAVVRATCENLLDRYLGKPRQQVDVVNTTAAASADVNALDQQIAELTREENRLLGRS